MDDDTKYKVENAFDRIKKGIEKLGDVVRINQQIKDGQTLIEAAELLDSKVAFYRDKAGLPEYVNVQQSIKALLDHGFQIADVLRTLGVMERRRGNERLAEINRGLIMQENVDEFLKGVHTWTG